MISARTVVLALGLSVAGVATASELKPVILLESRIDNKLYGPASRRGPMMERAMMSAIRKEFPCARVTTWTEILDTLAKLRECQRTPGAACASVETATPLVDAEYLVIADQTPVNDRTVVFTTKLDHVRKVRVLVEESFQAGIDDDRAVTAVVGKFVDALTQYELCPYHGTIKLSVRTEGTKRPEDVSTPVYCNGSDQTYRRTSSDVSSSGYTWAIRTDGERRWRTFEAGDREGKPLWTFARAKAEVSGYREERRAEESEEDPCHRCRSGRQAGRSSRSILQSRGWQDPDPQDAAAVVDLKFSPDGTYTIDVEAGSGGSGVVRHAATSERWAEGSCDGEPRKREKEETTATLPLRGRGFTARGTPRDRRLQANVEQRVAGPGHDEQTTIRWEVDLRRD